MAEGTHQMNFRRWATTALVLAAALATGGCAAESAGAGTAPAWVEPGWMAQFRQDMEAWQLEEIACYAEQGVTVTPSASGGVQLPIVELGVDPPGTQELIEAAMWVCFEQVELIDWWQMPLDEAAYERMLDSRECLVAHDHPVPDPPTFEVWLEGGGMWFPHEFVFDAQRRAGVGWTQPAWAELNRLCPQPGPNTFGVSGLSEES